jgi:hypothetical protein
MGGGSPSRSGRWVWATGYEGGTNSDFQLDFTNPPTFVTSNAWQGGYALRHVTPATIGAQSEMYKYFPAAIAPGKWGIEAMIATASTNADIELLMKNQGLAAWKICSVKIVIVSQSDVTLQYRNQAGAYILIARLDNNFRIGSNVYHNIKLVMDFAKNEYSRVVVDGVVYTMDGTPAYSANIAGNIEQNFSLRIIAKAASSVALYSDNVILTADEP